MNDAIAPAQDRVLHLEVFLPLSPAAAFDLFATNEGLQSWLAPVANVTMSVGGPYELFWRPDDRENDSTIGCRVTALAPGQLLAFHWRSPRQFQSFANAADPLTHVVVAFVPEGPGTRVHLVHSGWRNSTEWGEARTWQAEAWRMAFAGLERSVRDRSASA